MLRRTFNGKVLAELPLSVQSSVFTLPAGGTYALWLHAELLSRFPRQVRFDICNADHHSQITLRNSIFSPQVNGLNTGRMELYKFSAPAGNYRFAISKAAKNNDLITFIMNHLAGVPADASQYAIQVRESQPTYKMLLSIPLFTLSLGCMIGGLVLGLLAEQVVLGLFGY